MDWIPINKAKPKLGQKCLCFVQMERYDGSILKDVRILYYLKLFRDKRRYVFSDKSEDWYDLCIGKTDWPVTHCMPVPDPPEE